MVTAVYCEARSTNRWSASNREEFLYVTKKDRAVHRRQPLRVVVVEGIVIGGMASIQCKWKTNHYPLFFLGAD
ncbi:hypothetical protein TNCV_3626261 [Trichonephila clavipes]|nr:hypothetical protein TNCV_3626261 [Trichonephila clavipes]